MSRCILDVSVTMAWHFEDEASADMWGILDLVTISGASVPALWALEVANTLAVAERRNRSSRSASAAFVRELAELPIDVDPQTAERALRETLNLARRHGLSVYDAAYLELAQREVLPLATIDQALRRAAVAEGVELLPR